MVIDRVMDTGSCNPYVFISDVCVTCQGPAGRDAEDLRPCWGLLPDRSSPGPSANRNCSDTINLGLTPCLAFRNEGAAMRSIGWLGGDEVFWSLMTGSWSESILKLLWVTSSQWIPEAAIGCAWCVWATHRPFLSVSETFMVEVMLLRRWSREI